MSFCIQSVFCLDIFFKSTSQSSPYNPVDCLSSLFDSKNSIIWIPDKPTNFGTIKTAHGDVEAALCIFSSQGSLSLYNKDFLLCFIIHNSFSGISMYWANRIALSIFFRIEMGVKFYNIQQINLDWNLFSIESNNLMTLSEFLHWFTWRIFTRFIFIFPGLIYWSFQFRFCMDLLNDMYGLI